MNITIQQKKLEDIADTLFDLEKQILTRPYHYPASKIEHIHSYYKDNVIFFAYEQKTPIGYLTFKPDDDGLQIYGLGILPQFQGKKVGAKLLLFILQKERAKTFKLATHPHNVQALTFYFKFGFRIYGWKDNYYGNGQPRVLLHRAG